MSSLLLLGAGTDKPPGAYSNSETNAWVNAVVAAGGSVGATEGGYVDTLVSALKSAESISSLSQRFDRIVLLVTADTDIHQPQVDLVTAGTAFTFHSSAADTFAGQWGHLTGYAGVVANSDYLDTGFAPSSGPQFTLNAAHMSVCVLNARSVSQNYVAAGTTTGAGTYYTYIQPFSGTSCFSDVNAVTILSATASSSKGVWTAVRSSASAVTTYLNGASFANSAADTAQVVSTAAFAIGALNSVSGGVSDYSSDSIAFWHCGGALSNPSGVYTAFHNYMVSAGVASPP